MKEQVFRLIDHLFHMFASSYRDDAKNEANEVYYDYIEATTPAKPTAEEFLLWMQSQCNTPCHQCKMLKACNSNSDMCFGSVDIDLVLKLFNERKK